MLDNVLNISEEEIAVLVGDLAFTYEVIGFDKFELFNDSNGFEQWVGDNREVLSFKLVSVECDDEPYLGDYVEPEYELLSDELAGWVRNECK